MKKSTEPSLDKHYFEPTANEPNGIATREAEIKTKIHSIKAALQNLKSNFPQFKSVSYSELLNLMNKIRIKLVTFIV